MNPVVKRWIIGICVGICIPAVVFVVRKHLHRNDKYVRIAGTVGVDVNTWADVSRMYDKVVEQHTLTSSEMDQEQAWISHPNKLVRLRALVGLRYCTDMTLMPRTLNIMRTRLADSEPMMRVKTISSLEMVNDPNLIADIGGLAQDSSKVVRDAAQTAMDGATIKGKQQ